MKNFTKLATLLVAIFAFSLSGRGQTLLLDENFSYMAGTLLTANGWTNHSGTSNFIAVTAPTISYPGYLSSGTGNEVTMTTTGEDVNKTFTAQTSGTVYASCLVNITSATLAGDYFFHLGATVISTAFQGRVFVKKDATGNLAFGISRAGAVATAIFTPFSYSTNTTYLLVLRFSIVTGATNDVAAIYINPALNSVEPATGWTISTDTPADLANIGSVALRQGGATTGPALKLDGIRVAIAWSDIVGSSGPNLTVNPTSLSGFNYFLGIGPSTSQSFAVSGATLTPTADNITITGTTSYEVSADNTSFGPTATIAYSGGALASTNAYVRLKAGLAVGTYDGETVTVSGGGATAQNVTCNGSVSSPAATITVGTITGFGNVAINTTSTEKTYDVSGAYLTGNIVITPPAGFEISTGTGGSFVATNPITLIPVSNTVASTPIYVRFTPTLIQAYSGDITHVSSGATTQNVAVSGTGVLAEPSNNATGFTAGTTTITTIPLSWTDATGPVLPESYLIKGSTTSFAAIVDPADGTPETNSLLVQNVAFGVEAYTFTGLTPNTTYYFKIYPYTNTGTAINYKTGLGTPEASATTQDQPPVTYTWNQTGTAVWTTSTNWTPERQIPAYNDILIFDNGATTIATGVIAQPIGKLVLSNNTNLTLQAAATGTLAIGGLAGTDLDVPAGCMLNVSGTNALTISLATGATGSVSGNVVYSAAAHKLTAADASAVTFNSGAMFTAGTGFSSNAFGTTNLNSIVFASGSTYLALSGSNPFGAGGTSSVVVFQTGSLYKIAANLTPSFSGRTYANLEIDAPLAILNTTGTNPLSIDNLTITNGTLNYGVTGPATGLHQIKGNIYVATGAVLNFAPAAASSVNLNGTSLQTISGGGSITSNAATTLNINNTAGIELGSDMSIDGVLSLTNGLFTLGNGFLTLGAAATITGTPSASNMIVATNNGQLGKIFTATGSFTFPVGDNTVTAEYSPVTLNFTAGTFAGGAIATVKLSNSAWNGMTPSYLNRYWSVNSYGITEFACDAEFNYLPADVIGTEASLFCIQMNPPFTFATHNPANTTLHQLTATALTSFGNFTGEGTASDKTLNLTVFLEGLFNGSGMNKAQGEAGDQYPGTVADQITVELHNATAYATIEHTAANVDLNTDGTATITVPSSFSGSYYVTVKHRNSVETTTIDPLDFSGSTISYNFTTAAGQAFGDNLKEMSGAFVIYGGDANTDGSVDALDLIAVDNDATAFAGGYLATDLNGDGAVDALDLILADNNSTLFIAAILP